MGEPNRNKAKMTSVRAPPDEEETCQVVRYKNLSMACRAALDYGGPLDILTHGQNFIEHITIS